MNTGIPYELAVRAIFQEILNQERTQTITVRHDVTEIGRTTTHQIDVLWRFSLAGITYTTIVQAKDWASKVKKEAVLAFRAVLDDLPGQPRGLIVTRSGFQSGARELAKKHGISLYLLQPVSSSKLVLSDISWAKFSIDPVHPAINVTVYRPVVRTWFSFPDKPNARSSSLSTSTYYPREMKFSDVEGKPIGTIRDVLASFVDEMRSTGSLAAEFAKKFDQPTYLHAKRSGRKRCLAAVRAEIQISVEPQPPVPFSARGVVEFILKDLQTDRSQRHRVSIDDHP